MPQTENINIRLIEPLTQEIPEEAQLSRFSFFSLKEYPIHSHLHMEILYVLKGSLSIKVGVSNYTLRAGEFTIMNPFELHGLYCTDEPNWVCLLEISPRFYSPCEEGTIFVSEFKLYRDAAKEDFPKIREILKKIFFLHISSMLSAESSDVYMPVSSNTSNEEYEKILLRTLINYFELHFTAEYFLLSDHKENTLRDSFVQADRLKNILSYFYENFPQKIQLQDVAEQTFVNRYHISHLVKSGIGYTFSELLQHIRIEKAEIYLLGTDMPISRIVFELGFSSYRYFNQHFKSLFHMTPSAYRKKYQKETIRYKDISVLEPLDRASVKRELALWDARPMENTDVPEERVQQICLQALFCQGKAEQEVSVSDRTWPKEHIVYDSFYMPALLLSQAAVDGPDSFCSRHPCFCAEAEASGADVFAHQPAAVTKGGIRKSLFYALDFLREFRTGRCFYGPGYFLTYKGRPSAGEIRVLLYWTPIDIGAVLSHTFTSFQSLRAYLDACRISKTFAIDFRGLWQDSLPKLHVSEQCIKPDLDPFLQWQRMGCPQSLDPETIRRLNESAAPDTHFFTLDPEKTDGRYTADLKPFDVRLFCFTKPKS